MSHVRAGILRFRVGPRSLKDIPGLALAAGAVAGVFGAGCTRELPPYGQVHVTVATDAPVPPVVSRLRLDVYAQDGQWIDSRDVSLREPSAWPPSFAIYSEDGQRPARVRIRLRAYREGALRDYRGERHVPPPPEGSAPGAEPLDPPATGEPRLVRDGVDVTPRSEPLPESAIDRLAWVTLEEGVVERSEIVLRVACAGTMADLKGDATCVDARGILIPTPEAGREERDVSPWEAQLAEDLRALPPPRSRREAGDGTPLFDEEVLVPGGVVVLGTRAEAARTDMAGVRAESEPERVFVVPPLLVDRFEVTVGRYRSALARGFAPPRQPETNDLPFARASGTKLCTYSREPFRGGESRETMPLTCVTYETAEAFCRFEGGALPTEAAWEHIALTHGKSMKSAYPWGDEAPRCGEAVFGRAIRASTFDALTPCEASPVDLGPLPVEQGHRDQAPSGVHGLAGNVVEWVRDAYHPYRAACWAGAPLYDPECADPAAVRAVARGSSWIADVPLPLAARLVASRGAFEDGGFRCVRRR
jgi:formylglycine-generating enzyme required for sulfatase activity